jgi:hypothetical protein
MPNLDITYCKAPTRPECATCERNYHLHDFTGLRYWQSDFNDDNEKVCSHLLKLEGRVKP